MEKLRPYSNELRTFVERGIPLVRLEQRLRPASHASIHHADTFNDFSQAGFLGTTESLLSVISADLATVKKYGTTHAAIAQAIRDIVPWYNESTGEVVNPTRKLNPDYEYIPAIILAAGDQSCPWECSASGQNAGTIVKKGLSDADRREAELSQGDFSLDSLIEVCSDGAFPEELEKLLKIKENRQKPREIFYAPLTGLLPHLIEEHLFFEGRESPYRADPEFLIKAFDLGQTN